MSFEVMMQSFGLRAFVLVTLCFDIFQMTSAEASSSVKPLRVVTSTTDLAWAVRDIGGSRVVAESLLRGTEDPHFVDARPDYVAKVIRADIVCFVGLDLEVGWLPKVLAKSGRREIQSGGQGYCDASRRIEVLEKVNGGADRSQGDVHPGGNPHYWLSPVAMAQAGLEIRDMLIRNDPQNKAHYDAGYNQFSNSLRKTQAKLLGMLKSAGLTGRSAQFFEYHREFSYLAQAYGLSSVGTIEEKPGVPPSAGRLSEVSAKVRNSGVKVILAAATAPRRVLNKVQEMASAQMVIVPISVREDGELSNYHELQQYIISAFISANTKAK
jgi:zinc/manganese transport system substrate-binding protein